MACPICKTLWPRERALCESCAEKLWQLRAPVQRNEDELHVLSVFAWHVLSPEALRWLVMSLKGKDRPAPWREPALWMLDTFGRRKGRAVLVPVPSRGRNHALGLARALQGWTGWMLWDGLQVSGERRQKLLGRKERQSVRYERAEASGPIRCRDFTTVIIVDDVVTTGATAAAVHRALGRPRNCEVWCLMDRRPCGSKEALL